MRISDWSSDVCSSDLEHCVFERQRTHGNPQPRVAAAQLAGGQAAYAFNESCEHETFSSRWAMKNVLGHAAARGLAARCCLLSSGLCGRVPLPTVGSGIGPALLHSRGLPRTRNTPKPSPA